MNHQRLFALGCLSLLLATSGCSSTTDGRLPPDHASPAVPQVVTRDVVGVPPIPGRGPAMPPSILASFPSEPVALRAVAPLDTRPSFVVFDASSTPAPSVLASAWDVGNQDVNGSASSTNFVTALREMKVWDLSGNLLQHTDVTSFFCSGQPQLPECTTGGFLGDTRVIYDPGAGRWAMTGLWVFTHQTTANVALGVSQTGDPTGGWYFYDFPACQPNELGSDQPHTGFNDQWIVVTAACAIGDHSVAAFDKQQLYSGAALNLNTNYWKWVDPIENTNDAGGGGNRDNPVYTYGATPNHREYLTASSFTADANQYAQITYSHIEGPVDAPLYYPGTLTVTSPFQTTGGLPSADAPPSCTGCITAETNQWIHSSGVYPLNNGQLVILSTYTAGDRAYPRAAQGLAFAHNLTTNTPTVVRLPPAGAGDGILGSEITMPAVPWSTSNVALITYAESSPTFYPGANTTEWNLDTNTVSNTTVFREGNFTPTGYEAGRFIDFIGAATPIPRSQNVFFGARAAIQGGGNETYYAIVGPTSGCVTASTLHQFYNTPFADQTGTFTAQFDATPSVSPTNSIIGLSKGSPTGFTGYANLARFNPSGDIDARNGGAYAAQNVVPYSGGSTYHFRLVVNIPSHLYSIYVTAPSGAEQTIGVNYAFRTEQSNVSDLNSWGVETETGTTTVCNFRAQ